MKLLSMDSLTSFFLVLWTVVGISSGSSSSVLPDEIELPVNVGEVFIQPLDKIFKINATNRSSFSYRASLLNYPDLPPWVHYYASPLHETGFIYGAAIEPGITKIHIISTYVQNRETEEKTVIIKAAYKNGAPSKRRRHVEFFLTNLDLGDLFVTRRMESLMQVAKQIWPESSPDLTLTWLLGGKKSTKRPGDKQGVFVRLGSAAPFSPKLIRFQKESEPLYLRRPCPEDFKKTSGERYFRAHDFVVDWCSFRLVPIGRDGAGGLLEDIGLPSGGPGVTVTRKWSAPLNQFVRRQDLPQRTYVVDAMISLFLPAVISVAMVCLFTLLFCTLGGPTDTDCYSVEDLFPLYEQGDYADTAVKKAETSQKEEKAPSDTPAPLPSAKNGTASLAKSSFFGFGRQKKSEGNREAQKAPPNGATDSKMAGPDPSRGPIIQSFAAQHLANAPGCAADQSPNYSPSEDSSVATSSFRREPTGNNMFANHFHQPSSSFTPHAKDYYV